MYINIRVERGRSFTSERIAAQKPGGGGGMCTIFNNKSVVKWRIEEKPDTDR